MNKSSYRLRIQLIVLNFPIFAYIWIVNIRIFQNIWILLRISKLCEYTNANPSENSSTKISKCSSTSLNTTSEFKFEQNQCVLKCSPSSSNTNTDCSSKQLCYWPITTSHGARKAPSIYIWCLQLQWNPVRHHPATIPTISKGHPAVASLINRYTSTSRRSH